MPMHQLSDKIHPLRHLGEFKFISQENCKLTTCQRFMKFIRMNSIPANVKGLLNLRTCCVQSPAEEAPRKHTQKKLRESGEHREHNQQARREQWKEHVWISAKEVRVLTSGLQLQSLPESHEFWAEKVREIQRHTYIRFKKELLLLAGGFLTSDPCTFPSYILSARTWWVLRKDSLNWTVNVSGKECDVLGWTWALVVALTSPSYVTLCKLPATLMVKIKCDSYEEVHS